MNKNVQFRERFWKLRYRDSIKALFFSMLPKHNNYNLDSQGKIVLAGRVKKIVEIMSIGATELVIVLHSGEYG